MNNVEYEVKYNEYKRAFNKYAENVFSEIKTPNNLADSMKYSLFVGGKRIRPVLLISSCENKGISSEKYLSYALAIECIHTYSLIHDDLPALDNDVLRRGNPTNHVKFDEATAILAGDALLNFAYEFLISNCQDENDVKAIKYVAESGGYRGMLSGQKSDKEKENAAIYTENDLSEIYRLKTGRLIACPLVVAELLSGNENIGETENFGFDLGRLFQFADDYKDVFSTSERLGKSVGKDEKENKLSAIKVYGVKETENIMKNLSEKLKNFAKSFDKSGFLECFIDSVVAL